MRRFDPAERLERPQRVRTKYRWKRSRSGLRRGVSVPGDYQLRALGANSCTVVAGWKATVPPAKSTTSSSSPPAATPTAAATPRVSALSGRAQSQPYTVTSAMIWCFTRDGLAVTEDTVYFASPAANTLIGATVGPNPNSWPLWVKLRPGTPDRQVENRAPRRDGPRSSRARPRRPRSRSRRKYRPGASIATAAGDVISADVHQQPDAAGRLRPFPNRQRRPSTACRGSRRSLSGTRSLSVPRTASSRRSRIWNPPLPPSPESLGQRLTWAQGTYTVTLTLTALGTADQPTSRTVT